MAFSGQNQLTRNTEKLVRSLYQKKHRLKYNLCVCEGLRACKELYSLRPDLIEFGIASEELDVSSFERVKFFIAEKRAFEKLAATVNTQGIMLIVQIPALSELLCNDRPPFALVLDRIADPGNFGTILRTCVSAGLRDIWYSADSVDPYSEKTIRSAISSQFALRLHQYDEVNAIISSLKSQGYDKIYRTEPSTGKSCFAEEKLFDKSIIIFGNEANGIKKADNSIPVNIPMPGKFESLNVAQAVTVILFEGVRRGVFK